MTVDEFGAFALVFAASTIVVGLVRGPTSEMFVFKYYADHSNAFTARVAQVSCANILLAVAAAMTMAIIALTLGTLRPYFLLLAAAIPFLAWQDHVRLILVSKGRARDSILIDIVYLALQVVLLTLLSAGTGLAAMLLGWFVASVVSSVLGFFVVRTRISPKHGIDWLRTEWGEGRFYAGDFIVTNGVSLGSVFIISTIAGLQAVGAIRASQVLLAPILLLTRGLAIALGPEARRAVQAGQSQRLLRISLSFSGAALFAVLGALIVVKVAPSKLFALMLGESADLGVQIFPFAALATGMMTIAMGPGLALRAAGRVDRAFRMKVLSFPISFLGLIVGTISGGAAGSQIGLAIGEAFRGCGIWFELFRLHSLKRIVGVQSEIDTQPRSMGETP